MTNNAMLLHCAVICTAGMAFIILLLQMVFGKKDARLLPSPTDVGIMSAVMLAVTFLLARKYQNPLLFFMYVCLVYYLCITAYIDKKTSEVYCILNYAGLLAGSVFFLYQYTFVLNRPVSSLALILAGLTLLLSKALHLYGSGDGEIFGVVSVFILAGNSSLDSIFYLYMMYMAALLLITLTHLKDIDWENMRFKQPLPFAPSIFAATVLTLLVM